MLRHFGLCVGLYLGLGHFSVVEFWSMQGVSDALLGHAALRLRWPYLRLTLSNIHTMVGLLLRPLEPTRCRCRADMSGHCLCGLSRLSCCCAVWVSCCVLVEGGGVSVMI